MTMYIAELTNSDHYCAAISAYPDAAIAGVRGIAELEAPIEVWNALEVRALENWVLPTPGKGLLTVRFRVDQGPNDPTLRCRVDVLPARDGADFGAIDCAWWRSTIFQIGPSGVPKLDGLKLHPSQW